MEKLLKPETLPGPSEAVEGKKKAERETPPNHGEKMERVRRVELPTLCLASIRSSQLSYTRNTFFST